MGKSFTADQIKKRDSRYGFDYTTGSGQKRLMYKSMGRDIDPDAKIDVNDPKDHGADPMGEPGPNQKFKMVPSGDIVDYAEMKRRLKRFDPKESLAKRLFGISEGSLGRLSGDTSDILTVIVRKNKDKSGKDILNIVKRDRALQSEIEGISDDEMLTYIDDILIMDNVLQVKRKKPGQKEHVKVEMEDFHMSKAKKLISFVEEDIPEYYEAVYYLEVGEHGAAGEFPSFEQALEKARGIEVDEETWYTGVEGSGPKFAIVHITQDYIDLMNERDSFGDEKNRKTWMTAAQKALQSGKEVIGNW